MKSEFESIKSHFSPKQEEQKVVAEDQVEAPAELQPSIVDRIILKNGAVIEGTIIDEFKGKVKIEWEGGGGIVGFNESEIQSIERRTSSIAHASAVEGLIMPEMKKQSDWPEGAAHRIILKNGEIVGGQIDNINNGVLELRQEVEGGGSIFLSLKLGEVETIEIWQSQEGMSETLEKFKLEMPQLRFTQQGYYHILTSEKDPTDEKLFVKALNQFHSDFLMHFFNAVNLERSPDFLNVVILGTRAEFTDLLRRLGIFIQTNPIGFYHFDEKVLVFYNAMTDPDIQAVLTQTRNYQEKLDQYSEQLSLQNSDMANRVRGNIERQTERAERGELTVLSEARKRTLNIIRHEGAHQLFHLLGITPYRVYQGGWLIEGLAVYCEPDPIGSVHHERLMQLKYELESSELMPLEYVMNFSRGVGLHELQVFYTNIAYAQSWAFIHFLMQDEYRPAFFEFLKDMRNQDASTYDAAAEKALLEKHLGRSLKEIEPDFSSYVHTLIKSEVNEDIYQDYRIRLLKAS